MKITIDDHALLDLRAFVTRLPAPLRELTPLDKLTDLLSMEAEAPLATSDEVRAAVRDLLRHGGFKPTGRSKPASEYLIKAADDGKLSSINVAVDACNAVSLHSGLPISVVDFGRAREPFRIGITPQGASYVFNASGQTIDLGGLLCLFDKEGPCANAIKDSQRTKTGPQTRSTFSLIWGTKQLPERAAVVESWYRELLELHGAVTEPCWPLQRENAP